MQFPITDTCKFIVWICTFYWIGGCSQRRNSYWRKIDWSERKKKFWVLQKDCLFCLSCLNVRLLIVWLVPVPTEIGNIRVNHFPNKMNLSVTKTKGSHFCDPRGLAWALGVIKCRQPALQSPDKAKSPSAKLRYDTEWAWPLSRHQTLSDNVDQLKWLRVHFKHRSHKFLIQRAHQTFQHLQFKDIC